jgi:hypothetical protein
VTCTSPTTYPGVAVGAHVFRVRAIDRAGNVDPVPAERRWSVESPPAPQPQPPPPPQPAPAPQPQPPPAPPAPPPPRTGQTARCVVPRVVGRNLRNARRLIVRSGCRLGRVRRAYSTRVAKGLVLRQSPAAGRRLRRDTAVSVTISRGRPPARR